MFYFQAESEKLLLNQNLHESQANVERSQVELQAFMARLVQFAAHVDSLQHLYQKADQQFEEHNEVCLMFISKRRLILNSTLNKTWNKCTYSVNIVLLDIEFSQKKMIKPKRSLVKLWCMLDTRLIFF